MDDTNPSCYIRPVPKKASKVLRPRSGLVAGLKRFTLCHILLFISFFVSGVIVNICQLLLWLTLRPLSLDTFRIVNKHLNYAVWSQVAFIIEWWSDTTIILESQQWVHDIVGHRKGLIMMNHSYEIDGQVAWAIADNYSLLGNAKVLAKKELLFVPIIGWTWFFAEIFFMERDWSRDRAVLDDHIESVCNWPEPFWLLLYPEGTRFTPSKHAASLEFARSKDLPILENLLMPRTKGFVFLRQRISRQVKDIYDILMVFDEESSGRRVNLSSVLRGEPSICRVFMKHYCIDDVPMEEEGAKNWLLDRFKEKDELFSYFRKHGRFLPEEEKKKQGIVEVKMEPTWSSLLITITAFALVHSYIGRALYTSLLGGSYVLPGIFVGVIFVEVTFLIEWWSGTIVRLHGDKILHDSVGKERAFILMNHTYEIDGIMSWVVCDHVTILGNAKVLAKKALKFAPIIGWTWYFAEVLFLERDWNRDQVVLERQFSTLLEWPDPFWDKIKVIYNVQLGFDSSCRDKISLSTLLKGEPLLCDLFMERLEVKDIPTSDEGINQWMIDLFKRKDEMFDHYMRTNEFFPPEEKAKRGVFVRPLGKRIWPFVNVSIWLIIVHGYILKAILSSILTGSYMMPSVFIAVIAFAIFPTPSDDKGGCGFDCHRRVSRVRYNLLSTYSGIKHSIRVVGGKMPPKRTQQHRSRSGGSAGKAFKTKRRKRDLDEIDEDLKPSKAKQLRNMPVDDDLPGGGQHYCVHCARHFVDEFTLQHHLRSKVHKRRMKALEIEPYSIAESERAGGLGSYVAPAKRKMSNELYESNAIKEKMPAEGFFGFGGNVSIKPETPVAKPPVIVEQGLKKGIFLVFEGSNYLRLRLVLSTLTTKPVQIKEIRVGDDSPGLRPYEANFLRLLDKITNGSKLEISETGTSLMFKPGVLIGGSFDHDCNNQRGISYYLEPLLILAPFAKKPMKIRFTGVVSNQIDVSVDTLKKCSLPVMSRFLPDDEDLSISFVARGVPPLGGGEIVFSCPVCRALKPVQIKDQGKVKRVRGVAYALRVSPALANRVVDVAKGELLKFLPDVYINTDHSRGPKSGKSPGFGVHLVAESTTGCFWAAEAISRSRAPRREDEETDSSTVSVPEDVGRQAAYNLLEEIYRGGCVDSSTQSLAFLMMALGPPDVSKIVTGPLSAYRFVLHINSCPQMSKFRVECLRLIKKFLGVTFKLEAYDAAAGVVDAKKDDEEDGLQMGAVKRTWLRLCHGMFVALTVRRDVFVYMWSMIVVFVTFAVLDSFIPFASDELYYCG
ncbi:unnamed protein product, partial [Notodromas monacha]